MSNKKQVSVKQVIEDMRKSITYFNDLEKLVRLDSWEFVTELIYPSVLSSLDTNKKLEKTLKDFLEYTKKHSLKESLYHSKLEEILNEENIEDVVLPQLVLEFYDENAEDWGDVLYTESGFIVKIGNKKYSLREFIDKKKVERKRKLENLKVDSDYLSFPKKTAQRYNLQIVKKLPDNIEERYIVVKIPRVGKRKGKVLYNKDTDTYYTRVHDRKSWYILPKFFIEKVLS
jgi:hypothetical protein